MSASYSQHPPRPTRAPPRLPPTEQALTPIQAHYLKKYLIQQAIQHELHLLTSHNATLAHLGPPFAPPPDGTPRIDLPFIRYFFRQFFLTFPFMAAAPNDFYSAKLQPFFDSVLSRNLGPTSAFDESASTDDAALRKKTLAKIQRHLSLFLSSSTKLEEPEEVVRLTQSDLERLEKLSQKRNARYLKHKDSFEVNIISVRTVVNKGRVRSRAHEEFIIRTKRSGFQDIHVSRRYGDFRTLAEQLRKVHPSEDVPNPPPKDRSNASVASVSPQSPSFPPRQQQSLFSDTTSLSSTDSLSSNISTQTARVSLSREKNRLTLRAYLHSILNSSSVLASSPVLRSFLTASPIRLSPQEVEDAKRREEADAVREEGRKTFAKEIASRVDSLRTAIRGVKGDLMSQDGLTRIFASIKATPNSRDLPQDYQAVFEWARISLASTVFQQFVASDSASENLANLKRIHGLMPYFMLRGALRISNPISMIRSVLDLFMAQPFGGRSLLQRMFSTSLAEEVRVLQEDIEAVKDKIDDPVICEKIRQFIYAPKEIQEMFKNDSVAEKQNLITIVLRSGDEPVLSRAQMQRVARAHRAHAAYLVNRQALDDSDDDDGPQDEDAWLYEDIKVMAGLYSRLRDKEMILAIIFEGSTSELLKDIITIFYSPLAQVYKAANIADSLSDLQNFINDLIRTVEQADTLNQPNPAFTVQLFIDLIQRHEQAAYSFVHNVHSKGEGLFGTLMHWIELFIDTMREGLYGPPLSLEFLLPQKGTSERTEILDEVDRVAKYHYQLKLVYEDKVRKRFGRAEAVAGSGDADAEDEATQMLVNGVVGEIGFGELVRSDANDMAAEDSEEDSGEGSSSGEYETDSDESSGEYETDEASSDEDTEDSSSRTPQRMNSTTSVRAPQTPSRSTPRPPDPRVRTPSRQQTCDDSQTRRSRSTRADASDTPTVRKRSLSLSLKSKRSLNFLRSTLPGQSTPPPVPPLPPKDVVSPYEKPLPASPLPPSISEPGPSQRPRSSTSSSVPSTPPPPKRKPKKAKQGSVLKPPELEHIPKLTPVFVEMVRASYLPLPSSRERLSNCHSADASSSTSKKDKIA